MNQGGMTYADAGVDIDAGTRFTEMIRERVMEAWPEAAQEIGKFAGTGLIPAGVRRLSAGADGSGTKVHIAALVDLLEGIGQDAAAMSLVDLYVAGFSPAYLIDTINTEILNPDRLIRVIDSMIVACKSAGAVLLGGETAELPGTFKYPWMFVPDTMAIGFPDPDYEISGNVEPGQVVYGWESGTPASNGFSLIRKVFKLNERPSRARRRLERHYPELGETLAEALLRATPIYVEAMQSVRAQAGVEFVKNAHITGGGLVDNLPRVLPDDCKVVVMRDQWERPPIFRLIQETGQIAESEMDRTFNQGIMMASIASSDSALPEHQNLRQIGVVEKRNEDEPQVEFTGTFKGE